MAENDPEAICGPEDDPVDLQQQHPPSDWEEEEELQPAEEEELQPAEDYTPLWKAQLDKSKKAREGKIKQLQAASGLDDHDRAQLERLKRNNKWATRLERETFSREDAIAINDLAKEGVFPPGRDALLEPLKHAAVAAIGERVPLLSCCPADALLHQLDESSIDGNFVRVLSGFMFEGTEYTFSVNGDRGDGSGPFIATRVLQLVLATAWTTAVSSVANRRARTQRSPSDSEEDDEIQAPVRGTTPLTRLSLVEVAAVAQQRKDKEEGIMHNFEKRKRATKAGSSASIGEKVSQGSGVQ